MESIDEAIQRVKQTIFDRLEEVKKSGWKEPITVLCSEVFYNKLCWKVHFYNYPYSKKKLKGPFKKRKMKK